MIAADERVRQEERAAVDEIFATRPRRRRRPPQPPPPPKRPRETVQVIGVNDGTIHRCREINEAVQPSISPLV